MTLRTFAAILALVAVIVFAVARRSPELAADEEWWSQGVRDVYCDGLA